MIAHAGVKHARVGYVQFTDQAGQKKALDMNGSRIGGNSISVKVCK